MISAIVTWIDFMTECVLISFPFVCARLPVYLLGRIPEAFSRSKHHALGLPSLQNCEQVKFSHLDFISSVKFCFSGRKQRQTPNIRWDVATHKLPLTPYPSSACRCLQLPWHGKRDGSQSPFGIEHFMPRVPVAVGYGTQASAQASLPSS